MKKMVYIQAHAGISGDMFAGALLDLGADPQALEKTLNSLPLEGFRTEIRRVKKAGIDCCDFAVHLDAELENHDHDMEYLHGHMHVHQTEHIHGHSHVHRTPADVLKILRQADMTDTARGIAERIVDILAEAEAEAHGTTKERVHFHEVGAVDSIVDIVSAAVLLDDLQVQEVIVPCLCEGQGTVRTQHGILPVPVPAVASIVRTHDLPLHILEAQGEFVTPTGAAICAAVRTGDALPACFHMRATGCGAGKRTYEIPSLLRVMLLEAADPEDGHSKKGQDSEKAQEVPADAAMQEEIWKLESNIDDCSGEVLGYVSECLFQAGARDVHFLPVFMKKNRPAWQINILCDASRISAMEQILFRETTTIGIRRMKVERTVLPRKTVTVMTSAGAVDMKVCRVGVSEKAYPEYESVAALARATGRPFAEVFQEAQQLWRA